MAANDIFRAFGRTRDTVDIQTRRVGCEDASFLANTIQLLEDLLLDLHVLEDGLHHDVTIDHVHHVMMGYGTHAVD